MSFITPTLRPHAAKALRSSVSQCRHASHRSITVQLVSHVEGLGKRNAYVQVNPGRMRHVLFPEGKAVYVPWKRKSELEELIANAKNSSTQSSSNSYSPIASQPEQHKPLLNQLEWSRTVESLPETLTVSAPATSSSETLFGSIHLSDISSALLTQVPQLAIDKLDLQWAQKEKDAGRVESAGRVVKLGKYDYTLKVKSSRTGEMEVKRTVEIVPSA